MQELEKREKEKYDKRWKQGSLRSANVVPLVEYIIENVGEHKEWKLLDIGCGDGTTVGGLRKRGFECYGVDITLAGIKNNKEWFHEAPAWRMPFNDNEFDFTFSTDMMEHIPKDFVDNTINEIYRITKTKTIHCIAISPHVEGSTVFHLSIKPIAIWQEKFNNLNVKNVDTFIRPRLI